MRPWKVIRRPHKKRQTFANDKQLLHIYDLIGARYGVLPSEIAKLSWADLFVCVRCLSTRSQRVNSIIKKQNRKKSAMLFPNVSLSDLADLLG